VTSTSGPAFVSVLALVQERLKSLASVLQRDSCVVSVKTAVGPRRYTDGDRIECYLDAELSSGNCLGWWLEFRWNEGSWLIESSVQLNTSAGQDEILGLPARFAVDDEELVTELDQASVALVETRRQIDLRTY
jgi:hypothetical protein